MEGRKLFASKADIERTPEELKKHRSSGSVPVYIKCPSNRLDEIIKMAEPFITKEVWPEDIEILCRETPGANLDRHSMRNIPICICGLMPDGRYTRLSDGLVDRFDLDKVKKLCADNAQLCSFRIFPSRDKWDVACDMEKAIECAIWGVPISHEEFLALREKGLIEPWN